MVDVEQWAEVRRMKRVEGLSAREISRRTGLARDTVGKLLVAEVPPRYSRARTESILDPFKSWICEQLQADPKVPSQRLRELAAEIGYAGGKTIFDAYVREVRPRFLVKRTFQRTVYRPAELIQCDLWEPSEHVPVGYGQTRRGWVVTTQSCWSRAFAGTLIFSKEAPDILAGLARSISRLGVRPEKLVWDRESAIAGRGKPSVPFLSFCGQLEVGWIVLDAGDAQAKGQLERQHRFLRSNFEPRRFFANHLDFQDQLDRWAEKVNGRAHRTPAHLSRQTRSSRSPRVARRAELPRHFSPLKSCVERETLRERQDRARRRSRLRRCTANRPCGLPLRQASRRARRPRSCTSECLVAEPCRHPSTSTQRASDPRHGHLVRMISTRVGF